MAFYLGQPSSTEALWIARNIQSSEAFVKKEYPNENFISDIAQIQPKNKYSKGLIIPENVRVYEYRL